MQTKKVSIVLFIFIHLFLITASWVRTINNCHFSDMVIKTLKSKIKCHGSQGLHYGNTDTSTLIIITYTLNRQHISVHQIFSWNKVLWEAVFIWKILLHWNKDIHNSCILYSSVFLYEIFSHNLMLKFSYQIISNNEFHCGILYIVFNWSLSISLVHYALLISYWSFSFSQYPFFCFHVICIQFKLKT